MTIELGGNIKLIGFKELEPGLLVVVKKVVGNAVKKISEKIAEPKELSIHLKEVHKTKKSQKYELNAKLVMDNKEYNVEVTELNLFFALNNVLSKLEKQAGSKT